MLTSSINGLGRALPDVIVDSSILLLGLLLGLEESSLRGVGRVVVWEVTTRWKEDRRTIPIKMSVILNELRHCKKIIVVPFSELSNVRPHARFLLFENWEVGFLGWDSWGMRSSFMRRGLGVGFLLGTEENCEVQVFRVSNTMDLARKLD